MFLTSIKISSKLVVYTFNLEVVFGELAILLVDFFEKIGQSLDLLLSSLTNFIKSFLFLLFGFVLFHFSCKFSGYSSFLELFGLNFQQYFFSLIFCISYLISGNLLNFLQIFNNLIDWIVLIFQPWQSFSKFRFLECQFPYKSLCIVGLTFNLFNCRLSLILILLNPFNFFFCLQYLWANSFGF